MGFEVFVLMSCKWVSDGGFYAFLFFKIGLNLVVSSLV